MRCLLLAAVLLTTCKPARDDQPLSVEAYVWQPPTRPDVQQAVARASGSISRLHFLAAELQWNGRAFTTKRAVNALPVAGCGLVMRIGSSASRVDWDAQTMAEPIAVVRQLARLGPSEIQCDYDCPQRRLAGYQRLLDALQSAAGDIPVIPTTLPSWLDESDFPRLIRGRPGYVLQVHSLQLPTSPDQPATLFDPAAARRAATKASSFGIPFRIAMATYGCEVRFNAAGQITDVVSEDDSNSPSARRTFLFADPVASARLVNEWSDTPPPGLRGIVWYRLPVDGDRRNWPWETLQLVSRGESREPTTEVVITSADGARDLFITNPGAFPVLMPRQIVITSPLAAADGAGAYRTAPHPHGLSFIRRNDIWPWLDPYHKIPAGWLRSDPPATTIDWHTEP